MITGVGIGFVGFGLVLVYAALSGQDVRQELAAVFTGTYTPRVKLVGVKMAPNVTPAMVEAAKTDTGAFQDLFPAPAPGTFSTPAPKAAQNPLPRPPAPGGTRSGNQP